MFRWIAALTVVLLLAPGPAFAEGEDAAPQGEAAANGAAQYFELDPFTVTLFRNNAPAGMLTARLVLQLNSAAARDTVNANRVKLRDAMLRELHRVAEREENNGPAVDLDRVKNRMLRVAQRTLGPDIVDDVLVQALLRRGA